MEKPVDITLYFEVQGLATDEDGKDAPAGVKINMEECGTPPTTDEGWATLRKQVTTVIAKMFELDESAVRLIDKREFDENGYDGE